MSNLQAAAPGIFDGVTPSLGPLDSVVHTKIGQGLGIAWFAAFVYAAFHLISGISRFSNARRDDVQDVMAGARREMLYAGSSLVALAAVPLLYGALVH